MLNNELMDAVLAILRTAAENGEMDLPVEWVREYTVDGKIDERQATDQFAGIFVRVGNSRPNFPGQDVLMDADVEIHIFTHMQEDGCGCLFRELQRGVEGCLQAMAGIRTENWHNCNQAPDWSCNNVQSDGVFRGRSYTTTFHMITNREN